MKKSITLLLSLLSLLTFSSCAEGVQSSLNNVQNQGNESVLGNNSTTKLGNYSVIIESCRLATDYADNPVVIVKYKFTNNDSEPASFMWSISDSVFQNGVGLNKSYVLDDSANYSSDNQSKEIRQGVTLDVEVAYELNDTQTDIEVEVSELISFSDKKITKTFSLR